MNDEQWRDKPVAGGYRSCRRNNSDSHEIKGRRYLIVSRSLDRGLRR